MSRRLRCAFIVTVLLMSSSVGCKTTDKSGYSPGKSSSFAGAEKLKGPPKKDKRYTEPPTSLTSAESVDWEDAYANDNSWLKSWLEHRDVKQQEYETYNRSVFEAATTPAKKRTSAASQR